MKISKVTVAFFSPTGNVEKTAVTIGRKAAEVLDAGFAELNFGDLAARENVYSFYEDDLLVIGVPVYAGRIPNKILPFIQSGLNGKGTKCIPFVCFGNRSFDDGLSELVMEMRENGFSVVGAAAIVSEHAFCPVLATGRPDEDDLAEIERFAEGVAGGLAGNGDFGDLASNCGVDIGIIEDDVAVANKTQTGGTAVPEADVIPGNTPPGPYYTPLKQDGTPARFLKAKPKTDEKKCNNCMECVSKCPMGSIDPHDPKAVPGICIKCQACIHSCPEGARYFDDPDFISHRDFLAEKHSDRKENLFICIM